MMQRLGCDLIQEIGILLRLPQVVMITGQVMFHRYYGKVSFSHSNLRRAAASCVWLASKVEESPCKIGDVMQVYTRIERRRENVELHFLDRESQEYEVLKKDLCDTEFQILKELGFICHMEHPHKFIMVHLKVLEVPSELIQVAWSLANGSLRTALCVHFNSPIVACCIVYAAARKLGVPLPERWWEVFDVKWDDIQTVCKVMAKLYRQPQGDYIKDSRIIVPTVVQRVALVTTLDFNMQVSEFKGPGDELIVDMKVVKKGL